MRKLQQSPEVSALACGLLQDGERALFLCRKSHLGIETVELPCVQVFRGENPVGKLVEEFRRQTGIDAQAHEIAFEKRHNAGSRKRRRTVPALAFKMSAKNSSAKPAPEFSGYRWLSPADLSKFRLARNAEWLR
jgi:hypothetical protein